MNEPIHLAAYAQWMRFELDGVAAGIRLDTLDGRIVWTGFHVEADHPLTSLELRKLKPGTLAKAASLRKEGIPSWGVYIPPINVARRAHGSGGPRVHRYPPRRNEWTDDLLTDVLDSYVEEARRNPRNPVTSLARKIGHSRSTIHRMLKEAARRGLNNERGSP
jgi:hypothetical protein